ncbi:hypothetical protein [Limnofasciculus baicalensis]|uniref:DUF928 domain-containing protein n=1 Tax=Limnofasciculus baicalensis BBK-W-15 TaxID=2699891 RepID=A0AAE3GUS3_9CYAN|nr:hypothetical protein [Limnofasciculus baicalensis]MCP2731021.1 hypothetical protein [Limnofasciculus baicalensis BBK-W-15]
MFKLNVFLSTFLVTGIMITGYSDRGNASFSLALTPSPQSLVHSPSKTKSWQEIFKNFFNKKNEDNPPPGTPGSGIARGDICPITPRINSANREIWSNRPLFVWRGNLGRIEVRHYGSEEVLWSQTVSERDNRVSYTGEPLKAGETYQWVIFGERAENPMLSVPFKVMNHQDRDRIRVRLIILGVELKEKGLTPEEITWARANYFAEKELWYDFLQEVYSMENPSEELQEIIQQIPAKVCSR